jgi:hypothetical protein
VPCNTTGLLTVSPEEMILTGMNDFMCLKEKNLEVYGNYYSD